MILKKKKSYFEEDLGKNRNTPKKLWKTLKSLGLSSDKARQSKISFRKDCAIQFEALENANTFKRFYSELARGLQEKLPWSPNKFTSQTTKNYCGGAVVQWLSLLHNFVQLSLNSGPAQPQTLLAKCWRFAMVRISDSCAGWK